MRSNTIYISLGTNISDRKENLSNAILEIEKISVINKKSSLYKSEAWGFESEYFLNMVLEISNKLSAQELLKKTQFIEEKLGRIHIKKTHSKDYKSRIIDIDILFFDNQIISSKKLTIPHPLLEFRSFVLLPMSEINENFIHPKLNISIKNLLKNCNDKSSIKKL